MSASSLDQPRDVIRQEAGAWRAVADRTLGPEARLVSVSRFLPDSRVYATADRVAKIRRVTTSNGTNDLAGEAAILVALGRAAEHSRDDTWEVLVEDRVAGTTYSQHLMEQQDTKFGLGQRVGVLRRLRATLRDLHRQGISHGDLRPDNLILSGDSVTLIDFDRGRTGSRIGSAYRDWFGFGSRGAYYPVWKLMIVTLAPKLQTALLRVRTKVRPTRSALPAGAGTDIVTLDRAWALARGSRANARGLDLAYYALTYKGHHLTGERAWMSRWEPIAARVDFEGKTLLELGCNMGLLSSYAALAGATEAHGVDHDPDIVEAARAAAEAFQSGATFEHLDLMGSERWEDRLGGRDIVTALSVVHWLPDRERVLRFLGTHSELIYEGHDPLEVETKRLNEVGFDDVQVIMETERDRHVLHARRSR